VKGSASIFPHMLYPFAGFPNSLTVHPGWSEFYCLLAALTSFCWVFLVRAPARRPRSLVERYARAPTQELIRLRWRQRPAFGRSFCCEVPALTRRASIKLNTRVSLQPTHRCVVSYPSDISPRPDRPWQSRQAIILRLAALFLSARKSQFHFDARVPQNFFETMTNKLSLLVALK
jgi:hypothetical protein